MEAAELGEKNARYLGVISEVCRDLAGTVEGTMDQGEFPLVLGGDHSQAIGTISGMINGLVDFGDDNGMSGFLGGGVGLASVKYGVNVTDPDFGTPGSALPNPPVMTNRARSVGSCGTRFTNPYPV